MRGDCTLVALGRVQQGMNCAECGYLLEGLKAEGLELAFWRVALRPGRPMMNGRLGAMAVLGLPGNPVSAYVCAFLFLVPLIRKLAGRADLRAPSESAVLGRDLPENDERVLHCSKSPVLPSTWRWSKWRT